MGAADWTPELHVPQQFLHPTKWSFTVDEVLRETLKVRTLVRKPNTKFDVVGLRLHSYMLENDPVLTENDGAALHSSKMEGPSHT